MKFHVILSVVFVLPNVVIAQMQIPSASVAGDFGAYGADQSIWLSGKVAVEGSSAPPEPVVVVLRCGDQERARITSSRKGDFSMMVSKENSSDARRPTDEVFSGAAQQCELQAESPEYTSETLRLFGTASGQINQVGTIMLYPRTAAQGDTISVTSLAAPEKAKQAFEKGQEQVRKGKFQAACDFFRRAVQVYPQYAIAWLELGRAQVKQNDFAGAQQSLHQATDHDARLLAGYVELAHIALVQQQWKDLADSTEKILRLAPDATANAWFLNAAANFNLGDMQRAEAGVTRGLYLDKAHKVPQLEYLYAIVLSRRGAFSPAVEHLKSFLRLAPNDVQAHSATQMLGEFEKHIASTAAPSF